MSTYDDLRHTPIYQQALRTQSVMRDLPATFLRRKDWPRLFNDQQVGIAGRRLDHLFRRALDPLYHRNFPSMHHLSAIKLFVDMLDAKLLSFTPHPETTKFIEPRLIICREILARANIDLLNAGHPPVTADGFRQFAITNCEPRPYRSLQDECEDLVLGNPFYQIGENRLLCTLGSSPNLSSFYMKVNPYYWN